MLQTMSRAVVDEYLYQMDRAFYVPEGNDPEHSLLRNLEAVSEEEFLKPAPGGGRTIVQIAWHVAAGKFMYANHGFEDGRLDWPEFFSHWEGKPTKQETIDWLKEAPPTSNASSSRSATATLLFPAKRRFPRRSRHGNLIANMIEHDVYHSGEINLARALQAGIDVWPDCSDD